MRALVITKQSKYIYSWNESNEIVLMKKLKYLENQNVHFVRRETTMECSGFIVLASFQYDNQVRIYNTKDEHRYIELPKQIANDTLKIYDMAVKTFIESKKSKPYDEFHQIHIANNDDHELVFDTITFNDYSLTHNDHDYEREKFQAISAFSFNWPYLCFSGMNNQSLILMSGYE